MRSTSPDTGIPIATTDSAPPVITLESGSDTSINTDGGDAGSCAFDGKTVANGQKVTGFAAASVPSGATCASEDRLCTNGVLSGTFTFPTCAVLPPGGCEFNGAALADSQSVTAYQAAKVAFGQACQSQSRTCTNGALSGDFAAAACVVDSLHYSDLTPGTWTIPCQAGNGNKSYESRFIDGGDRYLEVLWTGWDNTCTNIQYREYQINKITEVVETPDATGTTFSWRYDKVEDGLKPASQAAADYFNQTAACGHTNYQSGVYLANTPPAQICGSLIQYWLVRIERTKTMQYVFPPDLSTGNATTPQTRPTAVDRTPALTRQLDLTSTVANPQTPGSLRP